ncbi:MAG: hypothetical protein GC168_01965 [Candidatus Hydrogenedens sp.]|nr:hypothetical protein [Candidatus Hydrogenedens sp.]
MAHSNARLRERLRLLYSWREEARRLSRATGKKLAPRAYYAALAREAEYYIRRTRDGEQGHIVNLGHRLREMLAQGETLEQRQHSGRISPSDAEHVRRELDERVERLRNEIGELNAILRAASSEELGGFAQHPIEEYPRRLGVIPEAKPKAVLDWNRISVISAIAVVAACAFILYYTSMPQPSGLSGALNLGADARLYLSVRNEGEYGWKLHVVPPSGPEELDYVQLLLFARETSDAPFRALPPKPGAWEYENRPIVGRPPISLPPTIEAHFTVDTAQAQALDSKPEAYKVEGRDASGRVLFEADTTGATP